MTTPTPSPRPAALVAALTKAAFRSRIEHKERMCQHTGDYLTEADSIDTHTVNAVLDAIAAQSLVLIPRAELEEAAERLSRLAEVMAQNGVHEQRLFDLAWSLSQRSRG